MFHRENLNKLIQAIEQLVKIECASSSQKREKHGQKLFLDAVLLRAVKTLIGYYAEMMADEKGKEMNLFKIVYKRSLNVIYPSARQTC